LLVTRVRGDARELLSVSLRDESWGEERLLTNTGYAGGPAISPDGSLLAYFGEQTGRPEVFLRSRHPDGSLGPVVLVGSGTYPDWDLDSSGGLVLRYFTPEDRVVKTIVSRGGELGPPRPVLDFGPVRPDLVSGDYASDGRYLLMLRGEDEVLPDRIELALGFDSEIARLAADGR
jgi:hypothetical protein